jgi:thioesterase domain-containing protein
MVFFRAKRRPYGVLDDHEAGWKSLVKDLEVQEVAGYHGECCREPYVRDLAEKLKRALRGVRAGPRGS